MDIRVLGEIRKTCPNLGNRYYFADFEAGAHAVCMTVCEGRSPYVGVLVQNASSRARRMSTGRRFRDEAEAAAAYKTPEIKAIIAEACRLAKTQAEVG